MQRVSITMSDGIADVRLVRADKMNALDAAMFERTGRHHRAARPRKRAAGGGIVRGGAGVLRRPRHGTVCGHEGEGR